MSKLFGAVSEVDSHNKSRQYDLALDNLLVTQCGWIRLRTTVSTVMTTTNCWKIFCYDVKRDQFQKLIRIGEFSERLAQNCFNNPFSTNNRNLEKNAHPFDEVDYGEAVYTCRVLQFSTFISPSTAATTIYDITQYSASSIYVGSQHNSKREEAR